MKDFERFDKDSAAAVGEGQGEVAAERQTPNESAGRSPKRAGAFPDTRWSVILGAAGPDGAEALAELCKLYWDPVHDFFGRLGCSREDARDRTQDFFARMIARNDLSSVDRTKVRWFRSWLRTCVKNYYLNHLKAERAKKRFAGRLSSYSGDEVPLATPLGEPRMPTDEAVDRLWDQCWAHALVERAVKRLSEHKDVRRRWPLFLELVSTMQGQVSERDDADIAKELGIKVDSVRPYRGKVRAAFHECLARELAAVPDSSGSLRDEYARLIDAYQAASELHVAVASRAQPEASKVLN
jgi:DNA-directed RNA polymerase specialized sigma24 family protein